MIPGKSPYRTLFAVYLLAVTAGVCEFLGGSGDPKHHSEGYADPVDNFPQAMCRLYPGSAYAEYLVGRGHEKAASRRIERGDPSPLSQTIVELSGEFREAALHYERAIHMGLRSEEDLAYNYAFSLILIQADPARIERAIADWHREFPNSTRRDLYERRRAIEQRLRQVQSHPVK